MQETAQRAVICSRNHWCHDKHLLPLACFASTPACSARESGNFSTYVSRLPASLLSVALGHQRAGFCKQPGLGVPETKLNLGWGGGGGSWLLHRL